MLAKLTANNQLTVPKAESNQQSGTSMIRAWQCGGRLTSDMVRDTHDVGEDSKGQ
jgi:hypothetical protein